jgi:hypothetical protein
MSARLLAFLHTSNTQAAAAPAQPASLPSFLLQNEMLSFPIYLPQSYKHAFSKMLKANSRQQRSKRRPTRLGGTAMRCRPLASQPHLRRVNYAPSTTRIPSSAAVHGFVSLSWVNIFVFNDATVSRWRRSCFRLALSTAQQWAYLM